MKLSLAWIFDHIDADWRSIDVAHLIKKFNETVAEIEHVEKIQIDLSQMTLVTIQSCNDQTVVAHSAEWNSTHTLPTRSDAATGALFIVIKENNDVRWAKSTDFGAEKEMILAPVSCPKDQQAGGWKKNLETTDWILDLDNKSVTHRPDLWGHRGIAREIAIMLNVRLKPFSEFLATHEIQELSTYEYKKNDYPISIAIKNEHACKRFSGMVIPEITNQASLPWMTSRLSRIDSRTINAVVDFTNYVMLDISQPMHAFDAKKIGSNITVRNAMPKEKLLLLDNTCVELMSDDLVVSDEKNALALAGIMGGMNSSITTDTTALFLESACFNASTIRHSATRLKLRTHASARFEKSLDPNQNTDALYRFLKLTQDANIPYAANLPIVSLGKRAEPKVIEIAHSFIEKKIGTLIDTAFISELFKKLDFAVLQQNQAHDILYVITVPPSRSTKDITLPEDLVEEVARFFGYASIPFTFPQRTMKAFNISNVMQLRTIKQIMASGLAMKELQQYSFYDEQFLKLLKWHPEKTLEVIMPVSENFRRLVTSLMPNLLKAVYEHSANYNYQRFFEWGRTWTLNSTTEKYDEKKSLAGIIFDQKKTINFYQAKEELNNLFSSLKLPVRWEKATANKNAPWFYTTQTANLFYDNIKIGTAGMACPDFLACIATGSAFIFELDGDFLQTYRAPIIAYKATSKFPSIERDISMLLPIEHTAQKIIELIQTTDPRINTVQLVDFFQKKEWEDKKSLTVRFLITDHQKTMTKLEADAVVEKVTTQLHNVGATIR